MKALFIAIYLLSASMSYGNTTNVSNDRGGYIIEYAIKVAKVKKHNGQVKLSGRCDSACTLYLGLRNICVTPSVKFGFHLPFGSTNDGNQKAKKYLLSSYPRWVNNWINKNGGLTNDLKVMTYSYAKSYIKSCK